MYSLEEILGDEPICTLLLLLFSPVYVLAALHFLHHFWLYERTSLCLCAFAALAAFISFSSCCNSLRTFIVVKCWSLGPFSVSPLSPCPDFAPVEPRVVFNSRRVLGQPPIIGKNQQEDKHVVDYRSFCGALTRVYRYERTHYCFPDLPDAVRVLGYPLELYTWKDKFGMGEVSQRVRTVNSASHVTAPPVELTDEVDLLCEQFAAMHLGASAQASAQVQHQDEPSSLMPAVRDAVDMQSSEEEADADSVAYPENTAASSVGTPFPDCDAEMEDSIFEDSNQIPSAAAGEEGPTAMDFEGDSLSMDNRVQEQQQQQESTAGPHATVAMHTAAALTSMLPAQEQSLPEVHTPVHGAVDYSVSVSGLEEIAVADTVEDSEHVQDVGDTTASDALALATEANMLQSLEESNETTVGNASHADVSSDFPATTNASTLVEESDDEAEGEEGEGEATVLIQGDERDLATVLDFSAAAPFDRVVRASADHMSTLPTIEEEDEDVEEEVHVGVDELEEGEEDPAVVPDASVAALSVRGVKRGRDATDCTFPTDDVEYASVGRRRVDEGDSNNSTSPEGQSEEENGDASEPIQDQDTAEVPDSSAAAPSVRGVKRGRDATDGTFSTDADEYASVGRRRVGMGGSISTNHGRSEEVRVGVDELENDEEAALLPPPQATPPPTVEDVLAEILGDESDEDFYS